MYGEEDLSRVTIGRAGRAGAGTGGMVTKAEAARIATGAGIPVLLTSAPLARTRWPGARRDVLPLGTERPAARLFWLAHATSPRGRLHLDDGAVKAVVHRRASLPPAGITGVDGRFTAGDPVDPVDRGRPWRAGWSTTTPPNCRGCWDDPVTFRRARSAYEKEVVHRATSCSFRMVAMSVADQPAAPSGGHGAGTASRRLKDSALAAMAASLWTVRQAAFGQRPDVDRAGPRTPRRIFVDRLSLSVDWIGAMADGLRQWPDCPTRSASAARPTRGLELRQLRVPLGVVGIIYEARPNVTADAAGLCLKSGNAVLLRGSSSARSSNAAIVSVLRDAVASVSLPADAIQLVDATSRDSVKELMRARGLVDVLIPRGGADLIRSVVEDSTVPVIETGVGNCHVYVDEAADLDMALRILLNAKTSRPSVCNAAESLLVHAAVADSFCPRAARAARRRRHRARRPGRGRGRHLLACRSAATEDDYAAEYLSLDLSAAVVSSLDDAIVHIRRYGSGHTEAIVTDSQAAARKFTAEVDAAAVAVNASTRFTDGGEFGFGAEIGISTQKLHARGPMGLPELTSTTYVAPARTRSRLSPPCS